MKEAFDKWMAALQEQSQGRAPTPGQLRWHWTIWQIQWQVIEAMQAGREIPTQYETDKGTIRLG